MKVTSSFQQDVDDSRRSDWSNTNSASSLDKRSVADFSLWKNRGHEFDFDDPNKCIEE
jgi:hypothetical protein